MPRYLFPKPYADFVMRLRVPSGFLLVAVFAWLSRPDTHSLSLGLPVSLLGLLLRGWAAGHLEKNRTLAASGPYAYTRNPLYLGTLIVAAGLAIAASQWVLGVLFLAVFLFVYLPVMQNEEQHLRALFPVYAAYANRVPLLIPRGKRMPDAAPFRWAVYKKNQEYQALLGFAAGAVLLISKAIFV